MPAFRPRERIKLICGGDRLGTNLPGGAQEHCFDWRELGAITGKVRLAQSELRAASDFRGTVHIVFTIISRSPYRDNSNSKSAKLQDTEFLRRAWRTVSGCFDHKTAGHRSGARI